MPVINGAGVGPHTAEKLRHFTGFMNIHVGAAHGAMRRNPWMTRPLYVYVDLNAGRGAYTHDGVAYKGTPLLAIARLQYELGLDWRACLFEERRSTFADLSRSLAGRGPDDRVVAYCADNRERALQWCLGLDPARTNFGLVLHDPNGDPDFDLVTQLAALPVLRRVDIAIYLAATTRKRVRMAGVNDNRYTLIECLERVDKEHWLVRQPSGADQWTFVIGTNWADFPQWKRAGFLSVKSPAGRDVLERLSATNDELRAQKQCALPELFGVPQTPALSGGESASGEAIEGVVRAMPAPASFGSASPSLSEVGHVRRTGEPTGDLPRLPL